jgi:hypothetical protein
MKSEEVIRLRADQIGEAEGRPEGKRSERWLTAADPGCR